MAIDGDGTILFSGIEDAESLFIATLDELTKIQESLIKPYNPVWDYLEKNNLIEYVDDIGAYVPVDLVTEENPTVQWISGYDDANNTPSNALKQAQFYYGHLHGVQMYNREEIVKNQGRTQRISLVQTKQEQLIDSLSKAFRDDVLVGDQDADGKKPTGLGRIVTQSVTAGGVAHDAVPHWQPVRTYKTGTTAYALASEYRAGMRKHQRTLWENGNGVHADCHMMGEDVYAATQDWAEGKLQLRLEDLKKDQGLGSHEMFTWGGNTYIYVPDIPAKEVRSYNFRRFTKVRIHRGTNFMFEKWQMMPNKAQTKKRDNLTYMSVYTKRRSANGKIIFS